MSHPWHEGGGTEAEGQGEKGERDRGTGRETVREGGGGATGGSEGVRERGRGRNKRAQPQHPFRVFLILYIFLHLLVQV